VRITAKYEKGAGGPGRNYVSGVLSSEYRASPSFGVDKSFPALPALRRSSDQAPRGFTFSVGHGVTWAFEIVMTSAPNKPSRGNDIAWWAHYWHGEIDFFEYFGWGGKDERKSLSATSIMIYDSDKGSSVGGEAHVPQLADPTRPHRYTSVIYPDQTMSMWIDGKIVKMHDTNWNSKLDGMTRTVKPPYWPDEPLSVLVSFAMRNPWIDARMKQKELQLLQQNHGDAKNIAKLKKDIKSLYQNNIPAFFKNSRSLTVRSIAVYQDKGHAGKGFTGGGIAPNTHLRHVSAAKSPRHK